MPFDVSGAIVFGSRVKGEATPDSDFDLLGSSSPQRKLVMNSRNKFNISLWERAVELEYNEREKERVDTLKALISTLKDYFKHKNIKKVFIVGSILKEGMFFHFSDIDIAVEGLKEGYFRSLSELEDLLKRDVDIIELESCRFRDLIEKHGIRVI